MRNTIPTLGAITCGRRLMPATAALGLLLAVVFAQPGFAQSASASDPPLNFGNNYFVRGDYVVAGAYGMTSHLVQGFATGTINIPDTQNKGITGQNQVPAGAEVIAAVLYWQTAEKVGQLGTGQKGFFRPVFTGGPASGYPITGVNLPAHTTVSFSSGGCSGTSTGKIVQTYRANVLYALPRDSNGNIIANGTVNGITYGQFEVRLPSVGNNTPLTLGATLVLVYRVLDPTVPLSAIVFYDGAFAPTASSPTMSQTVKGFYDALTDASSLTQIVASGQSNKFETVSFNGAQLSSLYGKNVPTFPGWYGNWDTVKWSFPQVGPNPMTPDQSSVQTQITANSMNAGCVSSAAIIVSTTVKNTDKDGLLDVWKTNQGYCDAVALDAGTCSHAGDPGWVDLPNTAVRGNGMKDVYVQLDYMCSSPNPDGNTCKTGDGINYSFDPTLVADTDGKNAAQKVVAAYAAHGIVLHVNETVIPNRPNVANVHAIQEPYCQDTMVNGQPSLCIFPNPPGTTINRGVISWPGGVDTFERQLIDPDEPTKLDDCTTSPREADCIPRFQPGAAISKHEVIFAHAVGQPKWRLQDGTLASVMQSGNKVTFTTLMPVGTLNVLGTDARGNAVLDPSCLNGRVTVIGAATNASANGTYCVNVNSAFNPQGNTFFITLGGSPMSPPPYTVSTDPNLAVVPGFTSTASGVADVGGHKFVVSLGRWGDPASPTSDGQNPKVIGGTLMHELGHAAASLAHGGPAAGAAANPLLFQSVITNCKPNYLSVMSYSRQVDGAVDYSGGTLSSLNKFNQSGDLTGAGSAITNWYVPWPASVDSKGNPIGSAAKATCDGRPLPAGAILMTRVTGPANTFSFKNADVNFDGNTTENLTGADDWGNADFAQTGATGAASSSSGQSFGGGGQSFGGGGQSFGGGGQSFGGGGQSFGGGGQSFGGGGQSFGGGGQSFGGGGEADLAAQDSVTHTIQDLTIVSEQASPRTILLQWSKPFGDIGTYNVYRSVNGIQSFTKIGTVPASQTTFKDTPQCNATGYQYFVTAVQSNTSPFPGQEGTQGNIASTILPDITDPVTGCYTFAGFVSPAAGSSSLQGSTVSVKWTLQDDFYTQGAFVSNTAANTLVAIGPISDDVVCTSATGPRATLALKGAGITFDPNTSQFSFSWNTAGLAQGCYRLEVDLDSGQPTTGNQPASAFQVQIYLSDVNESVQVTTTSLPNAREGVSYNQTLQEMGGVAPVMWTIVPGSGSLPPNLTLNSATGTLSGIPTTPGTYMFTVKATDSIGDFGTQALSLLVNAVVTNTLDSGAGSLRKAILDVNAAQPGPQPIGIVFSIPGAGVQTIAPVTPLPALTQPTILDATTQPGYTGTPIIELDGSNAVAPANGIHITAGSSTVRGLVIHSFSGDGILIDTNGGNIIKRNYVGTDTSGSVAQANTGNGIHVIDVANNVLGGPVTTVDGNVISGNAGEGIRVDGALSTGNLIQGNLIGTDASGQAELGNTNSGVFIRRSPGNSVIGNVVAGNLGFAGVTICGNLAFCGGGDIGTQGNNASGNVVQGNLIGSNPSLKNHNAGLSIDGAPNTLVGGATAALRNIIGANLTNGVQIFSAGANGNKIQGNVIASNRADGISVRDGTGNTFAKNSILGHTSGLGIDLDPLGQVNPNSAGGANNFPVITSAQFAGGTTTITGSLNGPANATFTVEFFSNVSVACNPSGFGEGENFLGSSILLTDASGNVVFNLPVIGPAAGNTITATSTDAGGTTSEFSGCAAVQ
jgi:parallel beta-helix repeat protein